VNRQRTSVDTSYQTLRGLLEKLTRIECDPAWKEPYRRSLVLLLQDAEKARPDDRLLTSKIRDARVEIEELKTRAREKKALPQSCNGAPAGQDDAKSLSRYAGTIKLHEDPLAYQNRIRGEWP
jgi:hypothetical protein